MEWNTNAVMERKTDEEGIGSRERTAKSKGAPKQAKRKAKSGPNKKAAAKRPASSRGAGSSSGGRGGSSENQQLWQQ